MLKVEYKCNSCKTVYTIEWDDYNEKVMNWIDRINKDTDSGCKMDGKRLSWFIPKICPVCNAELMKYYEDSGWNYDWGMEYIKYDYSKCNPKYEDWFSTLNG